MTYYIVLFLLVTDCIAFDRQPAYSNDPIEEEIFNLKGQRREMDAEHRKLLAAYFKNDCPKSGTFGLWQIVTQRNWVNQCKHLNNELNKSHDQLVVIDNKIELLKLKKSE